MEKLTGINLSRPVSVGSVHSIIMREKRMQVGACSGLQAGGERRVV